MTDFFSALFFFLIIFMWQLVFLLRGWIRAYAVCVVLWNTDTRDDLWLVTCGCVLSRNSSWKQTQLLSCTEVTLQSSTKLQQQTCLAVNKAKTRHPIKGESMGCFLRNFLQWISSGVSGMMQVFGDNCKFKSAVISGILPLVLQEGLCF